MELLMIHFSVSGVKTWFFAPPAVAFIISFFTSMGGVSGAFLLLPFQVSVLGFTTPAVSATNQLFNIIGIPASIWQFIREDRMLWPLALIIVAGTLPGVVLGAWMRIHWFADPSRFKLFAGLVLLYIGLKLAKETWSAHTRAKDQVLPENCLITEVAVTFSRIEFSFNHQRYHVQVQALFALCLSVGLIGGIYGIGGGAIIAPFLVSLFGLPVHTIAGAALMGTLATSVAGVLVYQLLDQIYPGTAAAPDWPLGIMFGIGGFFGMFLGAKCQKYVPPWIIKTILCACLLFVAFRYLFWST